MENFDLIMARVLAGEASPAEKEQLDRFIRSSGSDPDKLRTFYRDLKNIELFDQYSNRDQVFNRVMSAVGADNVVSYNRGRVFRRIMAYAASVLIFFSVLFVIYQLEQPSATEDVDGNSANVTVKQTTAGQKTRIFLPDRSVAWLNSESSLSYLSNFSDSTRDIYLTGEAYFEVEDDATRPFRVHTEVVTITALGTTFNVKAYSGEGKVCVALVEGKVEVEGKEYFDHLNPGEGILAYTKYGAPGKIRFVKETIDVGNATAWKDGILIFDSEKLSDAFEMLERWYGVTIQFQGNPDLNVFYSSRFEGESLDNVLESMRFSCSFDYTIEDKEVLISFN